MNESIISKFVLFFFPFFGKFANIRSSKNEANSLKNDKRAGTKIAADNFNEKYLYVFMNALGNG